MIGNSNLQKPIFIIGTGRSGSTIFYHMFAHHPNISYISGFNVRFPDHPIVGLFNSLGLKLGKGTPSEAYPLFKNKMEGYNDSRRDLKKIDVRKKVKHDIKDMIRKILKYQPGERFLYKYTGWPRIDFFNAIFPDAKFIHLVRDGRATAHSLLNVDWWYGWKGPHNWRWGELPEQYQEEWENSGKSFAVLAGIQWKIILDAIEKSKNKVGNRLLEIKYEQLVEHPLEVFEEVIEFSELTYSQSFKNQIKKFELENRNYKWKEQLPEKEKKNLTESLETHLKKYGYET